MAFSTRQAALSRTVAPLLVATDVTLLFTDVVDSTRMTRSMGDLEAFETLRAHRARVRSALVRSGGEEVEVVGDGFVLAFPDADRALDCALEIQRASAEERERGAGWPLRVRIGIHTGPALRDGERFFGETVIRCARICARATADEILVSRETREASRRWRQRLVGPRALRLKGFDRPQSVFHALAPDRVCSSQIREESPWPAPRS
jgi:class 3 adenylate cyclase